MGFLAPWFLGGLAALGVPVFVHQGAAALEEWLQEQGVRNIQNVNVHLTAARPWFEKTGAAPSDGK